MDLATTRAALLDLLDGAPAVAGATITYQAAPQPIPNAAALVIRASVRQPQRTLIGAEAEPLVQQDGVLALEFLFPRPVGMAEIVDRTEDVAALYRAQTLAGGITITGDANVARIGHEAGRIRWDVLVPWRIQSVERAKGDTAPRPGLQLPTTAQAFATVRNLWLTRIEQAAPGESWPGLRTFWDDVGPFAAPPALPWCGYWCSESASGSEEIQGLDTVRARALVQLHTDKSLGTAGADAITRRIVAEHNLTLGGVSFGIVSVVGERVTPAGTWQTSMRVPFQFDRLRR
jgi:hypothetical protein